MFSIYILCMNLCAVILWCCNKSCHLIPKKQIPLSTGGFSLYICATLCALLPSKFECIICLYMSTLWYQRKVYVHSTDIWMNRWTSCNFSNCSTALSVVYNAPSVTYTYSFSFCWRREAASPFQERGLRAFIYLEPAQYNHSLIQWALSSFTGSSWA